MALSTMLLAGLQVPLLQGCLWTIVAFFAWSCLRLWREFRKNCLAVACVEQSMPPIPGHKLLVHPHHLFAMILPRMPGINLGEQYTWRYKRSRATLFAHARS
jgi:hypothetical protein